MNKKDRIFLVLGVGGSGMASLSHLLLDSGVRLCGYDKSTNSQTKSLHDRGVEIFRNFEEFNNSEIKNHITDIIRSSAINKNPFLGWGVEKHIPIFHRSDILHEWMNTKVSLSVAGSHGKTSTTGMVAQILIYAGLDPSIMIGGEFSPIDNRGGKWGGGKYGVYESDESDGTFLNHKAPYRILTNVDDDHLDYYKTKENLENAFLEYIQTTSEREEKVILYADDPVIGKILDRVSDKKHIIAVGTNLKDKGFHKSYRLILDNDINQTNESCLIDEETGFSLKFDIPLLGDHYRKNASLAIAASLEWGIEDSLISKALYNYKTVKRRMEILFNKKGIMILDDYGHHPTEVLAVISAMRESKKAGDFQRTLVIFQPHRFTRTEILFQEFAESLKGLDKLYLLPIYSAGEESIPGVDTRLISRELEKMGETPILLTGDLSIDAKTIQKELREGDILLTLGAGDVRAWGEEISQYWEKI